VIVKLRVQGIPSLQKNCGKEKVLPELWSPTDQIPQLLRSPWHIGGWWRYGSWARSFAELLHNQIGQLLGTGMGGVDIADGRWKAWKITIVKLDRQDVWGRFISESPCLSATALVPRPRLAYVVARNKQHREPSPLSEDIIEERVKVGSPQIRLSELGKEDGDALVPKPFSDGHNIGAILAGVREGHVELAGG
jgi:hypothetical protein